MTPPPGRWSAPRRRSIAQLSGIGWPVPRQVDLAARHARCWRCRPRRSRAVGAGGRDRPRVGAEHLRAAAPRRHRRARVGGQDRDAAVRRGRRVKYMRRAEVVGVAHADRADAVAPARWIAIGAGPLGEHLADAVAAVEQHQRPGVGRGRRGRCRAVMTPHLSRADVPGQPQHAVRLVAPQVGLHQAVGDQPGIRFRYTDRLQNLGAEGHQGLGVEVGGHGAAPSAGSRGGAWARAVRARRSATCSSVSGRVRWPCSSRWSRAVSSSSSTASAAAARSIPRPRRGRGWRGGRRGWCGRLLRPAVRGCRQRGRGRAAAANRPKPHHVVGGQRRQRVGRGRRRARHDTATE